MSEKERYSDAELEEFRKLINDKIAAAQELYDELVEAINNSHGNMATPNPRYPNVAEAEQNDLKFNFMKTIDTFKEKKMNKSLNETQEI